jgi:hypothetical protein
MPNWQQRGSVGQQEVRRQLGPCNLIIPLLIGPPTRTCFRGGAKTGGSGYAEREVGGQLGGVEPSDLYTVQAFRRS